MNSEVKVKFELVEFILAVFALLFLFLNYSKIIFFKEQILAGYVLMVIFASFKGLISLITGKISVFPNRFLRVKTYSRRENPFYYWFHTIAFLLAAIAITYIFIIPLIQ